MRCLGCKAWNGEKCLAGVIPYKSKKEADGVGCNCNTRTIDKKIRENVAANMGMYTPNMNPEQFYNLCKEHGLEIIAVPVPPHGRLGDLDAVEAEIREKTNERFCVNIVHAAPTIIPAEEGER